MGYSTLSYKKYLMARLDLKKLGKILSILVVVSALFFVIETIWQNRLWLLKNRLTTHTIILVIAGSIAYSINCFILSTAWKRLLTWFDQLNATMKTCYVIYARTQIAKYIPGNIFHFAGRHAMGSKAGFSHGALAGAAIHEVSGLLLSSGFLAFLGIAFYGINQTRISPLNLLAIFITIPVITLFSNKLIMKLPKLRGVNFRVKNITETIYYLIPTYFLYVAFFLITGGILFAIIFLTFHVKGIHNAGIVIMSLAISWIAGFIMPGASAGVGVRETVMIVSLSDILGEPQSLFIALIFRLITVMGDFLFFLSSFLRR